MGMAQVADEGVSPDGAGASEGPMNTSSGICWASKLSYYLLDNSNNQVGSYITCTY